MKVTIQIDNNDIPAQEVFNKIAGIGRIIKIGS